MGKWKTQTQLGLSGKETELASTYRVRVIELEHTGVG